MSHSFINLKGCRQHNLKNFDLSIPKQAITVITGISGSGKSSLAFDTLFAEGQRRYLEHLSAQAHMWIKQMPKPHVDLIEGLSPTLAIGQHRQTLYALGTVATYTDIYDFLSLLYARIGKQHSPWTGKLLTRYSRQEIIDLLLKDYPAGSSLQLLAPIKLEKEEAHQAINRLQQMGFVRMKINGQEWTSEEELPPSFSIRQLDVVVDRLKMKEDLRERLAPSVETALDLGQGILKVQEGREGSIRYLTEVYVCPETSLAFPPLEPADFNFNSPRGACPVCQGKGGKEKQDSLHEAEWVSCPACRGARLKSESLACLIHGKNIDEFCSLTISACLAEIQAWTFEGKQALIAQTLIPPLQARLHFLDQVGLGYLSLNRRGKTLSDGEARRIQLASQIGAKLSGITYILDEPSLGLHRQDIRHLYQAIKTLKSLDNTLILVEHEKSLISQADYVLELGPGAGQKGGELIFQGTVSELLQDSSSLTGRWLSGKLTLPSPPNRKPKQGWLEVSQASLHNLKNLSMRLPLGCFVAFCGVSGSGKSTLALDLIGKEIHAYLQHGVSPASLTGYETIKRFISSEKQIERFSPRSIPATYVGLMMPLRKLFAETRLAKMRGYLASRFSLNKKGGRCEVCEGLGQIRVDMPFTADLFIPCEVCQGLRYNYETLQITWENRTIADVLALSAAEALQFFRHIPTLAPTLELMTELGLDYLTLGQPFNTLSGGEFQRLKLIADLAKPSQETTLYILDEPSSGLHLQDIDKLVRILHRLVEKGHTLFVIEHHLDILRQADWVVELGPGGGPQGGYLIFEGTPKQLLKADTPTGRVLRTDIS